MSDVILKNAYQEKPHTLSHLIPKSQGISVDIIGAKLLKIKVLDFLDQSEPITQANILQARVVCRCQCQNYCVFTVKSLVDPEVLPACSDCEEHIHQFIEQEREQGNTLTKKQAWKQQGIEIDPVQYSRMWLAFADHSNASVKIPFKRIEKITLQNMEDLGIQHQYFLARLRGKDKYSESGVLHYECFCGRYSQYALEQLQQYEEPILACSMCCYELRFSMKNSRIYPFMSKLSFKVLWKILLEQQQVPYIPFKKVYRDYLELRKLERQKNLELHLKDFLETYDFKDQAKILEN